MIKVQGNLAVREPVPVFLQGLSNESLADLSWTDPSLGVQDSAWFDEEQDQQQVPARFEKYGAEVLVPDRVKKVVRVSRRIEPMSADEVDQINVQQANEIRRVRNELLSRSDWTQAKDIPENISTPWVAYRQALRDVPSQAGFPWEVGWPDMPEIG